jgi:hypothetical protein
MATPLERVQAIVAAYRDTAREFSIPGTALAVSLQKAPQLVDGNLVLWLNVTRDGVPLPVNNPFVFVNPPLRRPGDTDDRPLLALVQMIAQTVREVAQWRP